MRSLTERVGAMLAWRSNQPAAVRWLIALGLFGLALALRFALGDLHGATPGLAFYPSILLVAALVGWQEAFVVLAMSVAAGTFLFLPARQYLQPIGWTVVGSINIAIIAVLRNVALELAIANERQLVLFQELQHRVANTLQAVVGTLQVARKQIASAPAEATIQLDDAVRRFAASADVHRRLNDPALFQRELGSILRDVVFSIIDHRVTLTFDVAPLDLSFDQMSNITLLVAEIANNAQKHVFQPKFGSNFAVSLRAATDDRAMLVVRDDGPGMLVAQTPKGENSRLGFKVIRSLTAQLSGRMTITPGNGTEIVIEFPSGRPNARRQPVDRPAAPALDTSPYATAKP
jgi:two-component sensor histidine kinase